MKFLCEGVQKLSHEQTDRHTDMTENITNPHTRVVMNAKLTTLAILESPLESIGPLWWRRI